MMRSVTKASDIADMLRQASHKRVSYGPSVVTRLLYLPLIILLLIICLWTVTDKMENVFGSPSPDWALVLAFILGLPALLGATIYLPGAYRWSMTDRTLTVRTLFVTRRHHWGDVHFDERHRFASAYHRTLRGKSPGLGFGRVGRPVWEASLFKGAGAYLTPPWVILVSKADGMHPVSLIPNIFPYRAYDIAEAMILAHKKNLRPAGKKKV